MRYLSALTIPLWLALLAATSCTVYAPMQPTAPMVRQARQAEIGASVQVAGRVEATAIYAPLPHLLVAGGLTATPRLGEHSYFSTAQYELGLGAYHALGEQWVLSGLGGFGQASSERGTSSTGLTYNSGLTLTTRYTECEASYHKVFGQLGVARVQPRGSWGVAYRCTYVGFSQLRESHLGNLPLAAMLRHELTLTARTAPSANGHWQLVGTAGLSVAGTAPQAEVSDFVAGYRSAQYAEANHHLLPVYLASAGVVYTLRPTRR